MTLQSYLDVAIRACLEAGAKAKQMQTRLLDIRFKGEKDIVTEADIACDTLIRDILTSSFPEHNIITEEDKEISHGSPFTWYVDPIDGTVNYSRALPTWAISVGLEKDGEMVVGAVYMPMLDETYTAIRGEGAFLNGKPIRVSAVADVTQAIIAHGDFNVSIDPKSGNTRNLLFRARALEAVQRIKCLGSAVAEGAYVAAGRMEGYFMESFKPWDVAAASLIVEEAGGKITTLSGEPWNVRSKDVLYSNGLLHQELLRILGGTVGGVD